ncbi:MAG TPA: maleylpyruvate isomerase family mycothiol-dependent enzyme [Jatrophihabitans sp.]|jgi:uncharacterized protein (TIGR03083 family)|uniref:maleylpyruvate isomerase family mycothiol-dependent enzyme n=1 Tax=Jatrophihabitans sp. TaxID=1932789 RepID=UPI002E066804|nr:maleylpyruvate isomerase family mycothiol-dependent enzyme [Jatrophihabitans sp.]
MDAATLIDHLDAEGPRLVQSARRAGVEQAVPYLDWNVGQLVRHTSGAHRWATAILRGEVTAIDTAGDLTDGGPDDADVLEWFLAGHADLVETLRAAPADLKVPTLMKADSARHFWARRQAHETAIHRADAGAAAGEVPEFASDLAQDGIAELLLGFGRGRPFAVPTPGTLALELTDGPSWRIRFGGERNVISETEGGDADAIVRGTSSEVYRWVWNRPSEAVVSGDVEVAARWAATVRIVRS